MCRLLLVLVRKRFGRLSLILPFTLTTSSAFLQAQTTAGSTGSREAGEGSVALALTFDAAHSTITNPVPFWFYGGGAELSVNIYRGLGVSANFVDLHAGNTGGGVPVNLLVSTFGPRYTRSLSLGRRAASVYGEGLIGEANGFSGVYPQTSGAIPSSNSFALQVGGGVDIGLTRHLAIRAVEASWLRSQLPNATTNVQNNIRFGAGVVIHTGSHPGHKQ